MCAELDDLTPAAARAPLICAIELRKPEGLSQHDLSAQAWLGSELNLWFAQLYRANERRRRG